jgi:hypothetical protein
MLTHFLTDTKNIIEKGTACKNTIYKIPLSETNSIT